MSREETAHYVATITEGLGKLIKLDDDMPTLGHLLAMATLEARGIAASPPLPLPIPEQPVPKKPKRARYGYGKLSAVHRRFAGRHLPHNSLR